MQKNFSNVKPEIEAGLQRIGAAQAHGTARKKQNTLPRGQEDRKGKASLRVLGMFHGSFFLFDSMTIFCERAFYFGRFESLPAKHTNYAKKAFRVIGVIRGQKRNLLKQN